MPRVRRVLLPRVDPDAPVVWIEKEKDPREPYLAIGHDVLFGILIVLGTPVAVLLALVGLLLAVVDRLLLTK